MKKAIAIFLSFLVILTNVGITFASHYCGGKMVATAISLGEGNIGCGMEKNDSLCDELDGVILKKANCCEDKIVKIESKADSYTPQIHNHSIDFEWITTFFVAIVNLYSFKNGKEVKFLNYSPPLIAVDIPILGHSFLI